MRSHLRRREEKEFVCRRGLAMAYGHVHEQSIALDVLRTALRFQRLVEKIGSVRAAHRARLTALFGDRNPEKRS